MLEEGPGAGMLNKILGGEVQDKQGKYGNEGKYGKYKIAKKYMGGKGRGMRGSTPEEEPGAGMLNRILGGESVRQNGKYGELKEVREKKEVRECGTGHKQSNNGWRGNGKEGKFKAHQG